MLRYETPDQKEAPCHICGKDQAALFNKRSCYACYKQHRALFEREAAAPRAKVG